MYSTVFPKNGSKSLVNNLVIQFNSCCETLDFQESLMFHKCKSVFIHISGICLECHTLKLVECP